MRTATTDDGKQYEQNVFAATHTHTHAHIELSKQFARVFRFLFFRQANGENVQWRKCAESCDKNASVAIATYSYDNYDSEFFVQIEYFCVGSMIAIFVLFNVYGHELIQRWTWHKMPIAAFETNVPTQISTRHERNATNEYKFTGSITKIN